jgi:hypothetical protein
VGELRPYSIILKIRCLLRHPAIKHGTSLLNYIIPVGDMVYAALSTSRWAAALPKYYRADS